MLDRQSGQITTGALPGRNKYALAFDGDRMRDKNAARAQRRLGGTDHQLRQATADEHRVRGLQLTHHLAGIPIDGTKVGNTMGVSIRGGTRQLGSAAIDGIGAATRRIAQEIHRHRPGPAADIPENRTGEWRQLGQRTGTRVALRQLAVIVKTAVRRGQTRQDRTSIRA